MCEVELQSKQLFSIGGIYSTTHDEDYIKTVISQFFSLTELEDIASSVVMTVKYIKYAQPCYSDHMSVICHCSADKFVF